MKTTLTIMFTSLMALASVAQGDTYQTLAGYRDEVQIPAGQTAFVVSATSQVVLEVNRAGKRPLQFRFSDANNRNNFQVNLSSHRNRNLLPAPSVNNPVPIAGPAKLILRTTGLITFSVPEQSKRTSSTSTRKTVRRFAKN